jgi:hypothetical protein
MALTPSLDAKCDEFRSKSAMPPHLERLTQTSALYNNDPDALTGDLAPKRQDVAC